MDGQHKIYIGQAEAAVDSPPDAPDAQFAATMLLAAYDHELFHPWRPGQERVWKATLDTLQAARGRVADGLIAVRLGAYRAEGAAGEAAQP